MLLALFICNIIAITAANPFHKYPFVFLLDIGNEELEKTNTEQIRVSIPGGSLAMKYPAVGDGDTISHVRVSGIDFGTDLKVNVVGGGPGYKYVMLVFMGNPGVSYDAVITLETLPNGIDMDTVNTKPMVNAKSEENGNSYQVSEVSDGDENDRNLNENTNDKKQYIKKSNSELMQSSSVLYNYANDEMTDEDKDEEAEITSAGEQDDDTSEKDDDEETFDGEAQFDESVEEKTYVKQMEDQENYSPRAEQYTSYVEADSNSDDDKAADVVDDNLYEKYQDLKPHFAEGFKIYPQSYIYNKQFQVNSAYDKEDPAKMEQMFNNVEVHNNGKYIDGSNSIDSDYLAAEY